jgi:glycosyltransferase involved in cell wall biosynthesis
MTRSLRILVLFGNIPLLGQERSNIQVMKSLQDAGAEVLFVTNDEYGHESIQPSLDSLSLKWTEARFPRLLGHSFSLLEWADRIVRIVRYNVGVRRAIEAFAPTHIHIANENHLLAALPVLLTVDKPVIYRLGDEPRDHRGIYRWLWRNVYGPRITRIVCISQFIARRLEEVARRCADAVIYNFPPDRALSAGSFSLPEFEGMTFGYMGQLSRQKGVDILFDVAFDLCSQRQDMRFVFAGDYSWKNDFAKGLIARAESAGLSDRLIFPGFVEDIPALLSEVDVHICPSVWEEPLGNVIVEAKRAALPSVVFPSGGIPELIEHEINGYICASKTHSELVKGLQLYLEGGRHLMSAHGEAARASLERLGITRERFTKAWLKVYESCR